MSILLVASVEFPFVATCSEKNMAYGNIINCMATNKLIVLAARGSLKYFFAPNYPIFQKSCGEEDWERQLQSLMLFKQTRQQGLQTFDFCVVNVNDEDTKLRLKRKVNELKLKMADMLNCVSKELVFL